MGRGDSRREKEKIRAYPRWSASSFHLFDGGQLPMVTPKISSSACQQYNFFADGLTGCHGCCDGVLVGKMAVAVGRGVRVGRPVAVASGPVAGSGVAVTSGSIVAVNVASGVLSA